MMKSLHSHLSVRSLATLLLSSSLLHFNAGYAETVSQKEASQTSSAARADFHQPRIIHSKDGKLETDLYALFARMFTNGLVTNRGKRLHTIWTRAYDTRRPDLESPDPEKNYPVDVVPGPTLSYFPGDWLQITLHNLLNNDSDPDLQQYDDNIPPDSQDDIKQHVPHEVNIPHNANNTNLHVHGMHVDPKQDNVTLIILPEDDNPSNYTPDLQRVMPDIDRWWQWTYGYRIPGDHLPGTHWYHAHKHGATSTHVENGMAGTLLLRPKDDADDIVPGLWASGHDRVMMLQEIANYGVQQGRGERVRTAAQASKTDSYTTDWPDITVNGRHQPELNLSPGQTERWRFIDAGANHRNGSYLWVGGLEPPATISQDLYDQLKAITDFESAKLYVTIGGSPSCTLAETFNVAVTPFPGVVKLVALDGITLHKGVDISPSQPVLLGPGNRADLMVQANASTTGTYYLVKNVNVAPPPYVLAKNAAYGDLFQPTSRDDEGPYWRYKALTTCNGATNVVNTGLSGAQVNALNNLSSDPFAMGTGFTGFQPQWPVQVTVDGQAVPQKGGSSAQAASLAPLIVGREETVGVSATPVAGPDFAFPGLGWGLTGAVIGGGGLVDGQALVTLNVSGPPATDSPPPPSNDRLSKLSPTTTDPAGTLLKMAAPDGNLVPGIPKYVSPIKDSDISGRQVIVFDLSGVKFNYQPPDAKQPANPINQFSLNGRQFDLDDFVGNPKASQEIREPVPAAIRLPDGSLLGTYAYNGQKVWTNRVSIDGASVAFFTNPGYYVPVVDAGGYYTYDYQNAQGPPTYQQVTGLSVPRQPEATTAEEWLLVNNSGIFHPFHIHINPFFVTEVGQMNYETSSSKWSIRKLQTGDPTDYLLNNWFDTIIIPPQGYVKIRLWLDIPDQQPRNPADPDTDFIVKENSNVFGAWVYHCHILRHEDRGMMMIVNVKPKAKRMTH